MNKGTKKNLIEGLYKIVLQENSKRQPKKKIVVVDEHTKKIPKVSSKSQKAAVIIPAKDQELEAEINIIRQKKIAQKQAAKLVPETIVVLKVGDRVRMIDGVAIGTIDTIEKQKAIVNYGTFTTNVQLNTLEKV